jgi:hypothetical protein
MSLSVYTFAKVGDTCFKPQEKLVYISVCGLKNNILTPELYQFNLLNRDFLKVFPTTNEITTINELSTLLLQDIDPPTLTFNQSIKQFVMTVLGKDNNNKNNIIEFNIKSTPKLTLDEIIVYQPIVVTNLPPTVTNNLVIQGLSGVTQTFQIIANNNPLTYTLVTNLDWYNLNNSGVFTFTPPTTGIFSIPFYVSNNVGPIYYTLTLNVSS